MKGEEKLRDIMNDYMVSKIDFTHLKYEDGEFKGSAFLVMQKKQSLKQRIINWIYRVLWKRKEN